MTVAPLLPIQESGPENIGTDDNTCIEKAGPSLKKRNLGRIKKPYKMRKEGPLTVQIYFP